MSVIKSPTKAVMASLLKSISDLKNEKNPKSHLMIYETLTQLGAKSSLFKDESCNDSLHSVAIPVTLQDISTGNDNLVLAALSFLGGLLQVVKFPLDKQLLVVEVLTEKLGKVSEKNLSRKLMWSLANIQFDTQLPESHLTKMLKASCLFLQENPPVLSLSTVCESLNALRNMGVRNKEYFAKNLPMVLSFVIPWLFNEADRIRELSLGCLEPFTANIAKQRLLDTSFQVLLRSKYYGVLSQLVLGESVDSLKIWSFLIQAFGTELHESVSLLNELLKMEESALKCKNPVYRQCALEYWKYIIDCFALNAVVLNNSKRIKLVLVPLKSTDTRTVDFSKTKIELWWYLLNRLGPDATHRFQEVTLPLLTFCFGAQDEKRQAKGTALVFSNILPLATTVLAGILSLETEFKMKPTDTVELSRSYPYLSPEDFRLNVDNFSRFSLLTLNLKSSSENTNGVYELVMRSFIERCCSSNLTEPLKVFIHDLMKIITSKPALMEVVFDVLTAAFSFSLVTELVTENMTFLLQWFVENEPLPAHPLVRFLTKFFEAAIIWNVARFTAKITDTLQNLSHSKDQEFNPSAVELWSKFASALIAKSHVIHLPNAHLQSLLLPLTWSRIESDEGVFLPWSTLLSTWAKKDSSVLEKVLNPRGLDEVDVEESTIHSVLSALRSELSSHSKEISSWIKRWIASWIKLADIAENKKKCTDLFVNFLSTVIEELKVEGNPDLLLTQVKSCLQGNTLSKEVSDILYGIFGPAATAFKAPNVLKLRKHNNICKLFSTLVQRNLLPRNKQKPKALDDFVVIQTPEKKKRVLTEHQKEVMRSKRRSTCGVPAMYNDLSQSSQTTDSMDTQSVSEFSVSAAASSLSVLKEEDALLEPPVVLQQTEVLNELPGNGNQIVGPAKTDEPATLSEMLKIDLKLRSKVSVQVDKLPSRRSLRRSLPSSATSSQSPSSTEECMEVFQRPGPASRKRGYKKPVAVEKEEENCAIATTLEPRIDESHDKENGLADTQPTRTSTSCSSSPRKTPPLEPSPTAVDKQEDSTPPLEPSPTGADKKEDYPPPLEPPPTEVDMQEDSPVTASIVPDEPKAGPIPATDCDIEEVATPQVMEPSAEVKPVPKTEKSVSDDLVNDWEDSDESMVVDPNVPVMPKEVTSETSIPSTDSIEASKENSTSIETIDLTCTLKTGDEEVPAVDVISETTPSAIQVVEEANIVEASPLTSEQLKSSNDNPLLENNNVESLVDSVHPETVQQKIPVVPLKSLIKSFSLRSKKVIVPKTVGPSPSTGKRGAHILELSRKIQNEPPKKKSKRGESPQKETVESTVSSATLGEVVVTPEGSPARTAPWLPRTYSPYASPSTGILKKRGLLEESEDASENCCSPASSASKSRRVSFADPEVSHSVKISPIKKKLSRIRTRRSLIRTYDDSLSDEQPTAELIGKLENVSESSEKSPDDETVSAISGSITAYPQASSSVEEHTSDSIIVTQETNSQTDNEVSQILTEKSSHSSETQEIVDSEETQRTAIYPAATDCIDSLALIVDRVTSPTSKGPILAVLEKLGVRTIGDFCALSETDIKGLDFKLPQHETIKQFLESHFARKSSTRIETQPLEPENSSLNDASPSRAEKVESEVAILSSDEGRSDDLIKSSDELKSEESNKTPDSSPNGQIITDSPEMLFSCPSSSNDINSCSVLASPETSDDCDEVTDDLMEISPCRDEEKLPAPNSDSLKKPTTVSEEIVLPDANPANDVFRLSADDVINMVEHHPQKDEIISSIIKKYMLLSFTVNGKVFPFPIPNNL